MKIGFIGLGNMGASLAKAVLQAKTGEQILLANRSQAKVDAFIANFGGYNIMAIATVREVTEDGLIKRLTVRPK